MNPLKHKAAHVRIHDLLPEKFLTMFSGDLCLRVEIQNEKYLKGYKINQHTTKMRGKKKEILSL